MRLYFLPLALSAILYGQAPAKPVAKPPAVAKPTVDPLIDSVVQLKKAGMGDELIIKGILKEKRAVSLGVPEMKVLKAAGVSDRVIGVLMDPDSAAPAPVAVVVSAPVVAAPALRCCVSGAEASQSPQ